MFILNICYGIPLVVLVTEHTTYVSLQPYEKVCAPSYAAMQWGGGDRTLPQISYGGFWIENWTFVELKAILFHKMFTSI